MLNRRRKNVTPEPVIYKYAGCRNATNESRVIRSLVLLNLSGWGIQEQESQKEEARKMKTDDRNCGTVLRRLLKSWRIAILLNRL